MIMTGQSRALEKGAASTPPDHPRMAVVAKRLKR